MYPAPSLIAFTVLSGLGLGLLAFLGLGVIAPTGLAALVWFGLGYGLTLIGLGFSTRHLGHPERALKAFSQWRTSWLSREAVLATAALVFIAPHAASLVFWGRPLVGFGAIGGIMALQTVLATAMIYAQLRTVPRWNHWTVPILFLLAALTGGAMLIGLVFVSQLLLAWLAVVMTLHWLLGDRQFRASGSDIGTATGLGARGRVRQLESPHTGQSYLLKEMAYVVARKHLVKLRLIALVLACMIPTALLWMAPQSAIWAVAAVLVHGAGMAVGRWLFFAEAEHVMGLYYDRFPATKEG